LCFNFVSSRSNLKKNKLPFEFSKLELFTGYLTNLTGVFLPELLFTGLVFSQLSINVSKLVLLSELKELSFKKLNNLVDLFFINF
jgi:hypothetical protein